MKRLKNFFKSKRLDNRGLTLIELLMAIAILAIIIVPVFGSFITSARVNIRARKTLAATDVAQTIFEGFADKTFEEVKGSISGLTTSGTVLSGLSALSTIDNNYYNDTNHYYALDSGSVTFLETSLSVNSTTPNIITINLVDHNAVELISGNGIADTVSANRLVAAAVAPNVAAGTADKAIMAWSNGSIAALAYSGIEMEGFKFDAIVTFLPMAKTPDDNYYTYCVTVTVYDNDWSVESAQRMQNEVQLNTMIGGMPR